MSYLYCRGGVNVNFLSRAITAGERPSLLSKLKAFNNIPEKVKIRGSRTLMSVLVKVKVPR